MACTPQTADVLPSPAPASFATTAEALRHAERAAEAFDGLHAFGPRGGSIALTDEGELWLQPRGRGRPARLALVSYGDAPAPAPTVAAQGPTVTLDRGDLLEWYHHGPRGVEQGFSLRAPPSGELSLTYAVTEALARPSGDAVQLVGPAGEPLALLGAPWAADAEGVELATWWEADGDRLTLRVDARRASWPIQVDPLVSLVEAVATSADATAGFGAALDAEGDLVAVGAPGQGVGDGLVVILERNEQATGAWGVAATLPSPPGVVGFGTSLSLDYPRLIVGSPGDPTTAGDARLFEHGPTGWVETHQLTGTLGNAFGESTGLVPQGVLLGEPGANEVGIYLPDGNGDLVSLGPLSNALGAGSDIATHWPYTLVGAPGSDTAYLHLIAQPSTTVATWSGLGSGFGTSVATDGERAVVGAPGEGRVSVIDIVPGDEAASVVRELPTDGIDDLTGFGTDVAVEGDTLAVTDTVDGGRVHVYLYDAFGDTWHRAEQRVGSTVALEADRLVIGRPDLGTGEVEVLKRTAESIGFVAEAIAPDAEASSGRAVAVDGDLVVAGAPNYLPPFGQLQAEGTVYTLQRQGAVWVDLGRTTVLDDHAPLQGEPDVDNLFGSAVALDGHHLAVGEPMAGSGTGRAHLFAFENGAWVIQDTTELPGASADARFGTSVDLSEGLLAVGAPGHLGLGAVQVEVVDLATGTLGFTTSWSSDDGGSAGDSLALQGDRVFVGAPQFDNATGQVTVLGIDGVPPSLSVQHTFPGTAPDARCGFAVDADADHVAIGCRSRATEGVVELHTEETLGWRRVATVGSGVVGSVDGFGASVALQGSRLFVGAPDLDEVLAFERNTGGADAWGEVPGFALAGAAGDDFGRSIAFEGDLLAIGAPQIDFATGTFGTGYVQVYTLDATHPPQGIDDHFVVLEDTPTELDVLRNDLDGDGDPLLPTIVDPPALGTVDVGNDGVVTYTPDPDVNGADRFTYTALAIYDGALSELVSVDVDIQPVNDPPVVPAGLLEYAAVEEVDLVVDAADGLLTGITDVDGPDLVVADTGLLATDGGNTVDVASDGSFVFQPAVDFVGPDAFRVAISDTLDEASALREVRIDVADAPEAPELQPQTYGAVAHQPLVVDAPGLAAGATFPPGERAFDVLASAGGSLDTTGSGAFVYHPPADLDEGVEVVQVQARMIATGDVSEPVDITFEVRAAPAVVPVAVDDHWVLALGDRLELDPDPAGGVGGVLRNDLTPPGSSLTEAVAVDVVPPGLTFLTHGGIVYEPTAPGTYRFDYVARTRDAESAPASVTLVVVPADDDDAALLASDDTYVVPDDGLLVVAAADGVLANDDPGATFALLAAGTPVGRLELRSDGGFTYDGPRLIEPVPFTYRATDGVRASEPTTVTLEPGPRRADTSDTGGPPPLDTGGGCTLLLYPDLDGDGFGDDRVDPVPGCAPGDGRVEDGGDCDDRDASSHPGAPEVADDGIDQDCDGHDASPTLAGRCVTGPSPSGLLGLVFTLVAFRRRHPGVPC